MGQNLIRSENRSQLTLTIAAPNASVDAPPIPARVRLASKLSKLAERTAQMMLTNRISDPRTKTGRLPKYSASGAQRKFLNK